MTHLSCGLASSQDGVQFILFPESAVKNRQVALLHAAQPTVPRAWKIGGIEDPFFIRNQHQAHYGFFLSEGGTQRIAYVIGEATAEGNGLAEKAVFFDSRRGRRERRQPIERQRFPSN